ncbi:MAG: hypothetical protein Kow00105_14530 [Phycisphaeraceae bacterium]
MVGEAVPLRCVPRELGLSPAEVRALIKRGMLPVHSFRIPNGPTVRLVRHRDLKAVRAARRKPALRDFADALQTMASQR